MSESSLTEKQFTEDVKYASKNFNVIQSTDNTLLVDLDMPEAVNKFNEVINTVQSVIGINKIETWKSKSGNTHKLVTVQQRLPFSTRIALQAALGSDGVREVLAIGLMHNGVINPSVLFQPKNAKVTSEAIEV